MSMRWEDVRIFLEVVRAGSLNSASTGARHAQSTVSRRMAELERDLKVQLFHRLSHGVKLTATGEAILPHALEMERAARLIETKAGDEAEMTGGIRLWATDGVSGYWLPPRMSGFHARYPGVVVEVLASQQPPDISRMEADIVVSWRRPTHPDLVALGENRMILRPCASRAYLEAYGVPLTLADLRRHRICEHLHYPRDGDWAPWAEVLRNHPMVCCRTNSSMTLGEVTKHGVGVSMQPISVVDREPNLTLLDLDGFEATMTFWLVAHRETKDVPRMRALIEYIRRELFQSSETGAPFAGWTD